VQLTPRQIRIRIAAAAQQAGSSKAVATAAGVSETRVSKSIETDANVPNSLLSACGMWRDEHGDVRLVGDLGPARVQILVVQASGVAGVAAAIALASAALGRGELPS
jgi:hypothetical protein